MLAVTIAIGLAAAGTAAPGNAVYKDMPMGVPLWRELRSGMGKSEFAALYPLKKAFWSPGCAIDIRPIYKGNRLVSIVLQGGQREFACFRSEIAALQRQHGPAKSKAIGSGFFTGAATVYTESTRLTWRTGPVKITALPIGNAGWIGYTVKTNDKYW